jgi:hypothetical protein
MSQLTDRLERDLREIAAGARVSPSAWESIVARLDDDGESPVALLAGVPDRSKRPVWIAVAAAALVVITGSILVLANSVDDDHISTADPDTTPPAVTPPSVAPSSVAPPSTVTDGVPTIPLTPFVGSWVSIDGDGSTQTMDIVGSGGDDYEIVVRDAAATACSGAPATMTGTGTLRDDETIVIAQPELTCDDGTLPELGGPPQAELANFTLELDPQDDKIVDGLGAVWRRAGSTDELIAPPAATVPALAPGTSGGMWPQATLDEVRAAQGLADAGDASATWQLDPELAAGGEPWESEVAERFIEEELGWEEFSSASFAGYASGGETGPFEVLFIRCAPGQTNPLNALYADAPPEIRGCAPTIDELTYETVGLSLAQPLRRGASGIWVVERWQIRQPQPDPPSPFGSLYPDYFGNIRVEQVRPPSDAEVTALLEEFLQARVDGIGAEQHVIAEPEESPFDDNQVPLLYATTGGAPYERFETQRLEGPVWPTGWFAYTVRLFAQGGDAVVEQHFHVVRHDGRLGLVYGFDADGIDTRENGQYVAVPHNEFAGTLRFIAPPLVPRGDGRIEIALAVESDARVVIGEDPRPDRPERQGCSSGGPSPAAGATELARDIGTDPALETTEPVAVSIAGIDALQMDVTFSEPDLCYGLWSYTRGDAGAPPWRMRLYLVDYPESAWPSDLNWRPQVLTIAVIAPQADFERALEQATPIVESLEFQPA